MKKITKIIIAVAALLLMLNSCEKNTDFDIDKCMGDWDFVTEKITRTYIDSELIEQRDTIYYLGTISDLGANHSYNVIIQYTPGDCISSIIDKHGNILTIGPGMNVKRGKFEGANKVHFNLGGYDYSNQEYIVVGTKRKGGEK